MIFAVAAALVFPAVLAVLYFLVLPNDGTSHNPALVAAFAIGKGLQFTFPVVCVWLLDRPSLQPRKPTTRGLVPAIAFAVVVALAMFALYFGVVKHSHLAASAPEKVRGKLREFGCDSVGAFLALACGISIVHSLFEEYYWRWFLFGQLHRRWSLARAIVVSSVGFMAHHVIVLSVYFPGPRAFVSLVLPFALAVGIGGGVWAWIYDRYGSLYAAWVSHFLIDAAVMVVGFDMVFR